MNIPQKTLKNGFQISEISLGTWLMGGRLERDEQNDDQRDIDAIKHALKQGMTSFDTAELYAGGYSETLLGTAIQGRERTTIFISTKVNGNNCSYQGIKNACEASLKRMNIEYIDLYYIHWKEENLDLQEAMKAMNELIDEGKIKYIGVSNFSRESLEQAQRYSTNPIVANQVHYNLRCREVQKSGLLEYCQKNDIMLVAWRPLEYGKFLTSENKVLFRKLEEKYNKTSFQIALNWLVSQDNVVTLFKSSTPKNIDENIGATCWSIEEEDIERLRNEFEGQISISDRMPLN